MIALTWHRRDLPARRIVEMRSEVTVWATAPLTPEVIDATDPDDLERELRSMVLPLLREQFVDAIAQIDTELNETAP